MTQQSEIALKKVIEDLIAAGTGFDVDQLEMLYHSNLQVIMISESGEKVISNKESFKSLFQSKRENGDAPLNTWAEFHHIETNGEKGHVIVSRKVNLTEEERKIVLSIDLVKEEDRWQVTREVIVTMPEN